MELNLGVDPATLQSLRERVATALPESMGTAEIAKIPLALREASQFSARVANMRLLQSIQDKLLQMAQQIREQTANGEAVLDRRNFVSQLRQIAIDEGLTPDDPDKIGTIQDITSIPRLNLIYDIQTKRAEGFAVWKSDTDPDALDGWPAYELVRIEDRNIPRQWQQRWADAGGKFYGGRMIALKTSPIWAKISRFGTPWPPFDFGSGMGLDDISREEAVSLGVIPADFDPRAEAERAKEWNLNDNLQASLRGIDSRYVEILKKQLGDRIRIEGDRVFLNRESATEGGEFLGNTEYKRDHLGRFAVQGSLSARDNIKRGKRATEEASSKKRTVRKAMQVEGLGDIDFEWGRPGDPKPDRDGKTHADGYGLSHILAKRGDKALKALPIVLAKGTIQQQGEDGKKRLVKYGKWTAVAKKHNTRKSYVITSIDDDVKPKKISRLRNNSSGFRTKMGTGSESPCPTQSTQLFAKGRMVASNKKNLVRSPLEVKPGLADVCGDGVGGVEGVAEVGIGLAGGLDQRGERVEVNALDVLGRAVSIDGALDLHESSVTDGVGGGRTVASVRVASEGEQSGFFVQTHHGRLA
jgi:hypothetical protein